MWRIVAVAAILVGALAMSGRAAAQSSISSAAYVLPGCRSFVAGKAMHDVSTQRICVEQVEASLLAGDRICPPRVLTTGQFVRMVTRYIERRPRRKGEPFASLTKEALRTTFPCR
ncbi:Rap1a/Tai family immunity protein [Belnapia moabensis]|uniref:Rap1a/Tai family immunity protein n=1 Tax=Belnapia moabensis TaxID=365533 RepID=UPI0012ED8B81|nr:Rap1a/Tai family immunity protein [Belnapia moabensis]